MYYIFICHFSKETIHPKVSVRSCQRADNEPRLVTFALMIHCESTNLIAGKERCHLPLCCPAVYIDGAILKNQLNLVTQIPVQFLRISFFLVIYKICLPLPIINTCENE